MERIHTISTDRQTDRQTIEKADRQTDRLEVVDRKQTSSIVPSKGNTPKANREGGKE